MKRGYVQIYTGKGKGKTTAALGLAVRAIGADLKVAMIQFLKKGEFCEICAMERFTDAFECFQFGTGSFIDGPPSDEDVGAACAALEKAHRILKAGEHDLVILDEATVAVKLGCFEEEALLGLIDAKPVHVELVITGREATEDLIERADLVTEMREIKHYYQENIPARRGIEH